ncbi:unnamed protein product [Agarophyton chilense]|eukprot:gb/GEZJ01003346.1/.p1 GENE.gb/GEZJ01003346.1/~~gb/GEZJ01003346.1/.p1  ORF type:complete len:329 (-),score=49.41 gb/GEZJ01003346.1/:1223-2209(-)
MRGVLSVLFSIAAGAAIGALVPQIPLLFINDPPQAEQYQSINENPEVAQPGDEQNFSLGTASEGSISSISDSHLNFSMSDGSLSMHSESVPRVTEDTNMRALSSEGYNSSVTAPRRPSNHTAFPPPIEVSIIRDVDVLALLDNIAQSSRSKHSDGGKCTFCIEPIVLGQKARITPCNHMFHAPCLEKWVLYVTASLMNVAAYFLALDGSLQYKYRFPFCPNCAKFLDVVPKHEWRVVLLTALAITLSMDSVNQATSMYERDVIVRDKSSPPVVIHIGADEYGFRPRWMDENEHYHYTFVARNEGYKVLLRVIAYPMVSINDIMMERGN